MFRLIQTEIEINMKSLRIIGPLMDVRMLMEICNFEEMCFEQLERNIGNKDEFRVSVGSEFQNRRPIEYHFCQVMTGMECMERTSESEDLVERGASPGAGRVICL